MPPGTRLVEWILKKPPVAIEACAIVTDTALFANTTVAQLGEALANPRRWVGWSVPQLIDRLGQVGVIVALERGSHSPVHHRMEVSDERETSPHTRNLED